MIFKALFLFIFLTSNVYGMRVISTSPAVTEMVTLLGHEKSIIGKTPYCQDASSAQNIGTALSPDYEKMLVLKPTHIFLQENTKGKVSERLKQLGLPLLSLKIVSLEDLFSSWRLIAKTLNASDDAIDQLEKRIVKSALKKKVLFVLGGNKGSSVMVAGQKTFYNDLARAIGLSNVVESNGWPVYDAEKVRTLVDRETLVFEFATDNSRLWSREDWSKFCPNCLVNAAADVRLTYPGPLMVDHFLSLIKEIND